MFTNSPKQPQIVSVTRLNRLARQILESEIGQVLVSGEISNFVAASSGHWYFTLKDNKAQVKTAMFKGANRYIKFKPKAGDKVVVRANLSIYEARGDYQLIAEHMEPEGQGQLKQAYEELKNKLSGMGLFAMDAKQSLPKVITKVGLVTSSTGAAVHDILTVMKRRNPSIEVVIYPSLVQGEQAAVNVASQIMLANERDEVDVLIVGRGGGSLEDLWAFNEEPVAHAIFNSHLPVISAVGHEVDVTIADYVADVRAPTPSAAAELVSQDQSETLKLLSSLRNRLIYATSNILKDKQFSLNSVRNQLNNKHPNTQLNQSAQHVDRLNSSLISAIQRTMRSTFKEQQGLAQRLLATKPSAKVAKYRNEIALLDRRLKSSQTRLVQANNRQLSALAQMLNSVSPLATLNRGYSISFIDKNIIKSVNQLSDNSDSDKNTMVTKLSDGEISSKIISIKPMN